MKLSKNNKNSIAIIGSRGIPNNYGGFECFTEHISQRLVEKGYEVYVSCEHPDIDNPPKTFKDVNLYYFPLKHPSSNFLGMFYEIIYDVYSMIYASLYAEQIYMLGYSAAPFFFIPKLFGKQFYLNPDGFEWKRNKFNGLLKIMLKINERLGSFWADQIVADSEGIKEYYDEKYDLNCSYIAYGASEMPIINWNNDKLPENIKDKFSTNPSYWLVVARLEPENNIHKIIEGYIKSNTTKPLVVVGNFVSSSYENYINHIIKKMSDNKKIIFTDGIYNQEALNMLRQNCHGYIHGHSVGGTNPSLLEAMAMNTIILAHDNQFNMEVCEDTALYFENSENIKNIMNKIDSEPENYIQLKSMALKRVKKEYSWDKISKDYEELFDSPSINPHLKSPSITKFKTTIVSRSKSK